VLMDPLPAEASSGVVKRRSLRSRMTARKTPEARVLVVNVLGSRRRSDASRVALGGEPQGKPGARASSRESVTPLVRVTGERRRIGALKSRRFIPMKRGWPCGRWACESCTQHPGSGHDGRHLGCRAASSRGIPSVGTRGSLGESGEANHEEPRASEARHGAQAAVRLEPARRCLVSDEGCQRTVYVGEGSISRFVRTTRCRGSRIREGPRGPSRAHHARLPCASGGGSDREQRCPRGDSPS